MRFKLDENIDPRAKDILTQEGHDVLTVQHQGLGGSPDEQIAEVLKKERRCLITLDLHFANILSYPPQDYEGIIVLRHPQLTVRRLLELVQQLAKILKHQNPQKQLWIIEPGKLRIYEP